MENKLTIAHIAPYLPYGLKMRFEDTNGREITLTGVHGGDGFAARISDGRYGYWLDGCGFKPVLRPLSQLTQEIEHNGVRFVPVDRLEYTYSTLGVRATIEQLAKDNRWVNHCEYLLIQHLLEWHFDINNLLSDGLAIEKGAEG